VCLSLRNTGLEPPTPKGTARLSFKSAFTITSPTNNGNDEVSK
jgi:hypothetical protein